MCRQFFDITVRTEQGILAEVINYEPELELTAVKLDVAEEGIRTTRETLYDFLERLNCSLTREQIDENVMILKG
jgi:hypothetical protein